MSILWTLMKTFFSWMLAGCLQQEKALFTRRTNVVLAVVSGPITSIQQLALQAVIFPQAIWQWRYWCSSQFMLLFSSPRPLPWHCTRVQQRVWSLSSLASPSSSDATCASFVPLRVCRWARSSTAWRLPCRQESASFSSTSFPCVSKERLQSTISQAETETQTRKSNSTGAMKPWTTSTERPRHWEYLPLPVYVAFFVVAFFVAPPGLPSPIHHCLGRCSCDRRLLSSFPPSETQNKRLSRRSPCWRSHLDQRSRSAGEDIDKKGDSTFFGRGELKNFKYNPMVFLVPLDAFFHCAIRWAWCHAKQTTEWDAVAMESLSALGCGFLYGRPLKG